MSLVTVGTCDDDPFVLVYIREALSRDGRFDVLWAADSGEDALLLNKANPVDVLLLDLRLPGLDGLAVCRQVSQVSHTRVLLLTSLETDFLAEDALRAGASGALVKGSSWKELADATMAAHGGFKVFSPKPGERLLTENRRGVTERILDKEMATATAHEREVARLLALGYSNADIGRSMNLTESSIKTYTAKVYRRLGVTSRAEALLKLHGWAPEI
ncbi:MAG TPA: response regulator transcription factor [Propionibacteriaceae bacterium]|nr:response regulator transcription factor [Propionibacteriaceae bacterium]